MRRQTLQGAGSGYKTHWHPCLDQRSLLATSICPLAPQTRIWLSSCLPGVQWLTWRHCQGAGTILLDLRPVSHYGQWPLSVPATPGHLTGVSAGSWNTLCTSQEKHLSPVFPPKPLAELEEPETIEVLCDSKSPNITSSTDCTQVCCWQSDMNILFSWASRQALSTWQHQIFAATCLKSAGNKAKVNKYKWQRMPTGSHLPRRSGLVIGTEIKI